MSNQMPVPPVPTDPAQSRPVYIIAEIGVNHNGSPRLDRAWSKRLPAQAPMP
ncbi:hypothetical protein [Paenibacillus sp. 1P07SE]|uniref:hypothetical protein n=1 Tax=Paenibacillus sp. 1P07SE TaxID=3132209 RepID=UPI0039A4E975